MSSLCPQNQKEDDRPGICASPVLAVDKALSASASAVFSSRQLMRGSCTKASSMAMTLSLFMRSTLTTFSHVDLQRGNLLVFLTLLCHALSSDWPIEAESQPDTSLLHLSSLTKLIV